MIQKKTNSKEKLDIAALLKFAVTLLKSIGITSSGIDAELLMAKAIGCERLKVILKRREMLHPHIETIFLRLLQRRLTYEPIAYILGEKEFFGLDFEVNNHCLIPRPDTECVVEACLELLPSCAPKKIIEIGVGSGAIIVSILTKRANCDAYASDISKEAIAIARKNAKRHGVFEKIEFIHSDVFQNFPHCNADLIISNPPYIGSSEFWSLMPDVRRHEPAVALRANDEEGISFYKCILKNVSKFLRPGGYIVMEIGHSQQDRLTQILNPKWSYRFINDLANNPRVLVLQKKC